MTTTMPNAGPMEVMMPTRNDLRHISFETPTAFACFEVNRKYATAWKAMMATVIAQMTQSRGLLMISSMLHSSFSLYSRP